MALLMLLSEEAGTANLFSLLRQLIEILLRIERHRRVCVQFHFGYL